MKTSLPIRIAFLTCLISGFGLTKLPAANYSWSTGVANTKWTSTTAWTPNGTPGASDNIIGNSTAQMLIDGNQAVNNWSRSGNNLTVVADTGVNSLAIHGVLSNTSGILTLRDSTTNTLSLNINTLNVDGGTVRLGFNSTGLTGFTATNATIGGGTFNSFMVEGGTATIQNLSLTNAASVVNIRYNSNATTTTGTGTLRVNSLSGTTGTIRALDASDNAVLGILSIQSTGSASYSGLIANRSSGTNGVLRVAKSGTGTQVFGGNNTYSGGTSITAGTLVLAHNNAAGTGGVTIDGGNLRVASGVTVANTISFGGSGGRLSGGGTVGSAVVLTNVNQTLAPGESPGILNFAVSESWDAFTYQWELNDWTGTTAGTNFDRIAITGGLDLTGDSAGSYILDITSLTLSNVAGLVGNFTDADNSWTILTTTSGITGFNASYWNIVTANFSSSPAATGNWSLALGNGGNDLVLSYSVVPEPRTTALAVAGLCLLLWRSRRVLARRKD
ncbi:MAG TPA: autotransporter-associated beta strand repeat-containing protein [Terrimicrobiaceae bacterium]|nr:autotransporter-associated beta strand repeat-containing protein [Terrimicrobiaceae bacterium]